MVENSVVTERMVSSFIDKDEPIIFSHLVFKKTRWNLKQRRVLIVTTQHIYLFEESSKLVRSYSMTELDAIVRSKVSPFEMVFVFTDQDSKDLRFEGVSSVMDLQQVV